MTLAGWKSGSIAPHVILLSALPMLLPVVVRHPGGEHDSLALSPDTTAARLYEVACAGCHGSDGTGQPQTQVGFALPLPDFTDCSFASREPNSDWYAVAHQGGPTRGFSELMPALGEALSQEQIEKALAHVREFCGDDAWPRGELNLPRALVTEKAYPEDEAVLTTTVAAEGPGAIVGEFLYEKRFGARSQIEVSIPIGYQDVGDAEGWTAGAGDVALGVKHALFHSLRSGSIFSLGGEVILPTGDESKGFGKGSTVLEPYLAFGQFLPLGSFVHAQALAEFATDRDLNDELAWRAALGRTWTSGRFGRSWTPMVEILGARELESGADINWDVLPQVQVTLNTRQHVMANAGVRIPLNNTGGRGTEVMVYLLWDWFDGGFFEGW